jgi:hypothetical protein
MSRGASPVIRCILANVCGVSGIAILGLLAGAGIGLAVGSISTRKAQIIEAAVPVDGLIVSDSPESRLVAIGTRPHHGRVGAGSDGPLAMLRAQTRACPLSVITGDGRCN